MIKAVVSKRDGQYISFSSSGHAGYADYGYDIVCAAVSALIINCVNSLEKFTEDKAETIESDGNVKIIFSEPLSERANLLMDSLLLGLTEIEKDYGKKFLSIHIREV